MTVRTPGTPASKIERTPVTTPASKIERTPATTPGGQRAREEKIVVTVRLRPLNKREQSAKDQISWECPDDQTIVYKSNPYERAAQPASFTFGNNMIDYFCYVYIYLVSINLSLMIFSR